MLASTKPGSAAAPGREGDGEDGWRDPIGSPLTASACSRRNCSILARIASKSSAARLWVRTTMTGNIVDAAEKNQTMPPGAHSCAAPAIGWTRETISPLRTDSRQLVSKICWCVKTFGEMMNVPKWLEPIGFFSFAHACAGRFGRMRIGGSSKIACTAEGSLRPFTCLVPAAPA